MTRTAFEHLVHAGVERIPETFRAVLQNVALVIEREPSEDQRSRHGDAESGSELLGLYEGTPRTERAGLPYRFPDKITLFQGPIERLCAGNLECIQEEVAHTVWHELAHVFGSPDDRLQELEADRGWDGAHT